MDKQTCIARVLAARAPAAQQLSFQEHMTTALAIVKALDEFEALRFDHGHPRDMIEPNVWEKIIAESTA